jgi:hypothetical protein
MHVSYNLQVHGECFQALVDCHFVFSPARWMRAACYSSLIPDTLDIVKRYFARSGKRSRSGRIGIAALCFDLRYLQNPRLIVEASLAAHPINDHQA